MSSVTSRPFSESNQPRKLHPAPAGPAKKVDDIEAAQRKMVKQVRKPPIQRPHTPIGTIAEQTRGASSAPLLIAVPQVKAAKQSLQHRIAIAEAVHPLRYPEASQAMLSPQALFSAVNATLQGAAKSLEKEQKAVDPSTVRRLLQLFSGISQKDAQSILGTIKKQNPVGTLASVTNLTRAVFQLPMKGAATIHHTANTIERIIGGRQRLQELLQAKAPEGLLLGHLALHPTCCKELLAALKSENTTPSIIFQITRLENLIQAADSFFNLSSEFFINPTQAFQACRALVQQFALPEADRSAIHFISKHILRPQLPSQHIVEANKFFALYDFVAEIVKATKEGALPNADLNKRLEMISKLVLLYEKEPKTAVIIMSEIARIEPNWKSIGDYVQDIRKLLPLLASGTPAQIAHALQNKDIAGVQSLIAVLKKNSSFFSPHKWKAIEANISLVRKLRELPSLLQPGREHEALTAFNELLRSTAITVTNFKAFYNTFFKDSKLIDLRNLVEKDLNTNYTVTYPMESFVTAALLSRCIDQQDFKQFKQVMQENTRKGEMTSPRARFEAIRAVCEIIIMPTASPAKQALFKQYLAQFK